VGGKFNLTTCSLKLKSSIVGVLIDSIFVIGGKLLFSTNSDNFVCSFFTNEKPYLFGLALYLHLVLLFRKWLAK
jgi:hypothetical protein